MKDMHDVIIKPLLSEKAYDYIPEKKYTFLVDVDSNKQEIKQAVEEIFGVKVEKVNTISVKGKKKRMGRNEGYTSDWKKAIVTLTADSKTIEFFDGMI